MIFFSFLMYRLNTHRSCIRSKSQEETREQVRSQVCKLQNETNSKMKLTTHFFFADKTNDSLGYPEAVVVFPEGWDTAAITGILRFNKFIFSLPNVTIVPCALKVHENMTEGKKSLY